MERQVAKRIATPEEAVHALALAAHTARQAFCVDEPPLPTLLTKMTWSAEEIALRSNRPQSVMDGYYRTVYGEHPAGIAPLTARELLNTQAALLEYIRQTQPGEPGGRLFEGVAEWCELLKAAAQDAE
jgi:hypothetical protein